MEYEIKETMKRGGDTTAVNKYHILERVVQ